MLILIVAGGPDKGRIYELQENQSVILGREGDQIKLNDRKCSRKHAKIWSEGGKWYVRDLHSRHGTHVNATQVENRHELQDGDHVQIGGTIFVLARMTPEIAERTALLGAAPAADVGSAPVGRLLRPRLVAGSAAAAAAVVIGSNAFLYLSSKSHTDRLYAELQDTRTQTVQKTDQLLKEVRSTADAGAETGETQQTLREILATVQAQREQEKLLVQIADAVKAQPEQTALLRDMVAKLDESAAPAAQTRQLLETILARVETQPQEQAKTREMLAAVLERVESQPTADLQPLIAEVKAAAEAARQQQQTLAARADQQDALLRESLAELRAPLAIDPKLVESLQVAAASEAGNSELLKQILANLEGQRAIAAEIGALRQLVEAQPAATQAVLREIVQSLPSHDGAAVATAVNELKRSVPQDVGRKLDEVLTRLDQQTGSSDRVAAALKAALDDRQVVDSATLQQLTSRIEEFAAAQPSADQLVAAIQGAETRIDPTLLAKLDAIATELASVRAAAADNGADSALAETARKTQELLTTVLDEVRNREPLEGLRAEVQRLADAQGKAPQEVLNGVLAAIEAKGDPEAESRIAEMAELMRSWPSQTEAMLKEMVSAMAKANDPGSEQIDQVLAEIRQRTMGRFEELDQAIRNDIRSALAQELEPAPLPATPARGRATRSAVLASPMSEPIKASTGLTATEEAYKVAFETGRPVTIGAGVVNAQTGAVSEGRTLDPAAAKAAGIKDWREWYAIDDFAERMRMRSKELRYKDEQPGAHVITLPSNIATRPNAIEQAAPAKDEPVQKGG